MIDSTGPKISSCAIRMEFFTLVKTVAFTKLPASNPAGLPMPPVSKVAPSSMPMRIYSCTRSNCFWVTMGPMVVSVSVGMPTLTALSMVALASSFTSLRRCSGTSRRVAATQAWPLLMYAAKIACGMAVLKSASSKIRLGDLPPSSKVTRFMLSTAPLATAFPA